MTTRALTGRLLVATPILGDPNFDRTVVLMLEHADDGAIGLVLNRPSELDVGEPLPEWELVAAAPPVIFVGGPVAQTAVIGLGRREASGDDTWKPVVGGVGIVDLGAGPAGAVPLIEELRLFAGYAGWGAGQLEAEIDAGAWWVVDAVPGDALSPTPEGLWSEVLGRQPRGRLAMHAHFPMDPSAN